MRKLLLMVLSLTALSACDTIDSHHARQAQQELVGMSRGDLFACAGLPNRSQTVDGYEYDTYDYQPFTPDNSLGLTLPLLGGISLGSGGTCHATAILKDGRISELDYAGDTGGILGHVAECISIVNHCQNGMKAATGQY